MHCHRVTSRSGIKPGSNLSKKWGSGIGIIVPPLLLTSRNEGFSSSIVRWKRSKNIEKTINLQAMHPNFEKTMKVRRRWCWQLLYLAPSHEWQNQMSQVKCEQCKKIRSWKQWQQSSKNKTNYPGNAPCIIRACFQVGRENKTTLSWEWKTNWPSWGGGMALHALGTKLTWWIHPMRVAL